MRLIDADEFGVIALQGKSEEFLEGVLFMFDKIHEAPTIEERPHGEWKADGTCSECGVYSSLNKSVTYFCPNCGADMRVKNELNRVSKELNSKIEKSKSEIVPDYRDGWRMKEGESNE